MPIQHRQGFPHSEICGSKVVCTSPQLIAAYHVLHRLLVPRHPPCALTNLAASFESSVQLKTARRTSLKTLDFSSSYVKDQQRLKFCKFGAERDRTADLLLAKQALSQLSYSPLIGSKNWKEQTANRHKKRGPRWARTTDLTLIKRTL